MDTERLIRALARDAAQARQRRIERGLAAGALAGLVAVATFVAIFRGVRPDLFATIGETAGLMKIGVGAAIAAAAFQLLRRLARPGARPVDTACVCLMALAGVIAAGCLLAAERTAPLGAVLDAAPSYGGLIALLSGMPLLTVILGLSAAAPTRPAGTGAAAGLLASALGGLGFAIWCPADDVLFVAASYGLSSVLSVAAGAALGRVLLRW